MPLTREHALNHMMEPRIFLGCVVWEGSKYTVLVWFRVKGLGLKSPMIGVGGFCIWSWMTRRSRKGSRNNVASKNMN